MPLGDFTVARDDFDIVGAVSVGSGGSVSGSMLWRVADRGFDDGGVSCRNPVSAVADRWILCRMMSLVCLAFDMLTVMQHSDTNPVALAGFNEFGKLFLGE